MVDVGKLIDGVLSVRHKGKWRRKLCILEKQATFSNCLRLFVFDEDGSTCRFQDVVHAFISFLDPNRQGTLMLVCNYKVRCIAFDQFDVLNKWVEILHFHLISNYFHADLLVASQGSRLAKYAARRPGPRFLLQKRGSLSGCNSGPRARYGLTGGASGDGYLHVTRDRICFTTGPSCPRPRLLATWNFDNDEIVQCGTARLYPHDTGLRSEGGNGADYLEAAGTDAPESASLFFLTAFPDHPEAPGSYLFLSDRATELCEWIEHNNRSAVDQAEWRRLTSMAAILESPRPTSEPNMGLRSPWDSAGLFPGQMTDWTLYSNQALSMASSCPCSAQCSGVQDVPGPYPTAKNLNHCSDKRNSLEPTQSDLEVPLVTEFSVTSAPRGSRDSHEGLEPVIQSAQNAVSSSSFIADEGNGVSRPDPISLDSNTPASDASSMKMILDFRQRKLAAMHSRHRFSSHPVAGASGYLASNRECDPGLAAGSWSPSDDQPGSMSIVPTGSFRPSLSSRGPRWRQSEPQLVTLSPIPIPLSELQDYLKRHSKGRTTCPLQSCVDSEPPPCSNDSVMPQKYTTCNPFLHSVCRQRMSTTVTSLRQHTHPSECSVISASDSTTSSEPRVPASTLLSCASHCQTQGTSLDEMSSESPLSPVNVIPSPMIAASPGVNAAPVSNTIHRTGLCSGINWFAGRRRRRLPSSWSNTTSVAVATVATSGSEPDKTDLSSVVTATLSSRFATQHPHFLDGSLSNGNSPQCHITPLHPTCTVVPGSQYFVPRRRHTASASEAFSIRSGFSSADPCQNTSFGMGTPAAPSTKTSLISLAASAIPLWAEAPTRAKPRTGCNYVSRQLVTALHAQRKHQQQQQPNHNQQHPPPRSVPSSPSYIIPSGCPSACYTSSSTQLVHPHPCTPVPEAPRENDDVTSKSTKHWTSGNTDRICPTFDVRSDKVLPSTSLLEPHAQSHHKMGLHPTMLKLSASDSLSTSHGKGDGVVAEDTSTTAATDADCRFYINVVPSSHRAAGLQPIEEGLFYNSSSACYLTQQPVARRALTQTNSLPMASCSSPSGLPCSAEAKEPGGCGISLATSGSNDLASSTQGSYVNIAACAFSNGNENGHTASNSSICTTPAQYINLVPPALRSCCCEVRGGQCDPASSICNTQSLCQPKSAEMQEINTPTGQAHSTTTNKQPGGLLVSSSSAHLCPTNFPTGSTTITDRSFNGAARASAPGHKLSLTLGDSGPRLNYAHLILSTDSGGRNARSPVSMPSSNSVNSIRTQPFTQLSDHRCPSLQAVQSLPCTSTSGSTSNVAATSNAGDAVSTNSTTVHSSGLNYVTIDLVQTKALSELERELRGAMEIDNGLHPTSNSTSRRITFNRMLANSATLPGSSTALEIFNRTRGLERASSHCGGTNGSSNGKPDGFGISFPTRMLSRLVQSLNFHHHNHSTQSPGIERTEKQGGGRKRLG